MSEKIIRINQRFLESCATATLIGTVVKDGEPLTSVTKVVLEFEQTSLWWRQAHGGPDSLIVPEYTIGCLIEDVLSLQARGIIVECRDVASPRG
jgi:hypothetical protein